MSTTPLFPHFLTSPFHHIFTLKLHMPSSASLQNCLPAKSSVEAWLEQTQTPSALTRKRKREDSLTAIDPDSFQYISERMAGQSNMLADLEVRAPDAHLSFPLQCRTDSKPVTCNSFQEHVYRNYVQHNSRFQGRQFSRSEDPKRRLVGQPANGKP